MNNSNNGAMDGITTKIAKFKSDLNISSLTMFVTKSSMEKNTGNESPASTTGFNKADTNTECDLAGSNRIPLSYTARTLDVFGFLSSKGSVEDVPPHIYVQRQVLLIHYCSPPR